MINAFARANPDLRRESGYQRATVAGRPALRTTLANTNEATGRPENIQLVTLQTNSGDILYALGVAPSNEFNAYRTVFNRVVGSLRLTN
jgi:hypothetical protein